MRTLPIVALALTLVACAPKAELFDRFPTDSRNSNYPSVSAPMVPQQLVKLPAGSIAPGGWILRQLELERDGLCGHLHEISAWLQKDNNSWLSTGGEWGWEEVPYWLRGFASLGYSLGDERVLDEAKVWIEAILTSQREDGNFGPSFVRGSKLMPGKTAGMPDYWPNMLALWILQDYYEYCGDERVIPFMQNYMRYLSTVPDEELFATYWENSRAGDNLWSVAWLYARTGEQWLLELGEKIHRCTADWTKPTSLPNWHNVNIAQCFREPATWYMFNADSTMLAASYNVQSFVRRAFGQVPGGCFGADENARIGYFDPRQGMETCGFAEQMASDEIMMLITGDPAWAENCEDVAFNSFPASFTPDYRALRYFTCPNMAISDSKPHRPSIQNNGPFLGMNPFSSRCCQHNHGFAWTYYNQYLVMATPDDGAAILLYNSCTAKMKVADGKEISLTEETKYPFEETVGLTVGTDSEVAFPLYLRIPKWTSNAVVKVNGRRVGCKAVAGKYLRIERTWKDGDRVEMLFPMEISMRTWAVNKNSVSVDYGPLTLSLKIGEEYRRYDGQAGAIHDSRWQEGVNQDEWPSYDIFATTPWNYALKTDARISVEKRAWPEDNNPFTLDAVPLVFKAEGRLVPSWGFDDTGLTSVLPEEDAPKYASIDAITLVPMGAARLRISAFPTCE